MKKNPQKYDDTVVRYFDDDVVILYDAYPKVCIVVSGILFFKSMYIGKSAFIINAN